METGALRASSLPGGLNPLRLTRIRFLAHAVANGPVPGNDVRLTGLSSRSCDADVCVAAPDHLTGHVSHYPLALLKRVKLTGDGVTYLSIMRKQIAILSREASIQWPVNFLPCSLLAGIAHRLLLAGLDDGDVLAFSVWTCPVHFLQITGVDSGEVISLLLGMSGKSVIECQV